MYTQKENCQLPHAHDCIELVAMQCMAFLTCVHADEKQKKK